jgi:hypothetical protein
MPELAYRQRFQRGAASAEHIEAVAREVLAELAVPGSEAGRAAARVGIDPAEVTAARVEIAEGEQGVEPVLTTIVVGIAVSAGSKIAESLWKEILWPRIRRRLGADALGPQTLDSGSSDTGGG